MARYSDTERIGVNAVESLILRDLGWIFREQPTWTWGSTPTPIRLAGDHRRKSRAEYEAENAFVEGDAP